MELFDSEKCSVFLKTKEQFGGCSNMCAGFPIVIEGVHALTSEALFQAMKYPDNPKAQESILTQRSPIAAKMKSRSYQKYARKDWLEINLEVMDWCIRVKLSQNYEAFKAVLLSTGEKPIVELSYKDKFWGACPDGNGFLKGKNHLGRQLQSLREECKVKSRKEMQNVPAPRIDNFLIYDKQIGGGE